MLHRLRDLKEWSARPVTYRVVLFSFIGILLAIGYTAYVSDQANDAITAERQRADMALRDESRRAEGALRVESDVRQRDLCQVVLNVHKNAHFRLTTERRRLVGTREYLRTARSTETPALRAAIIRNLPVIHTAIRAAKRDVAATTPPPTCKAYSASPHHHHHKEK